MSEERSPTVKRFRRLHVVFGLLLITAVGVWWSGLLANWPRAKAVGAIEHNNLLEAENWIRQAIWLNPDSAESAFVLARIQRKRGLIQEFDNTLRRALLLGLSHRQADNERLLAQAQAGDIEPIQRQLDDLLIRGEWDGREVLEAYVNGCLRAARIKQAKTLIDGWAGAYPNDAQPYYFRGRLRMYYRDHQLAEQEFRTALEKQADHQAAAYLLGQALLAQNRTEEALAAFQKCRDLRENAAVSIAQAKTLRTLGRVDEARVLLLQVVDLPEADIRQGFQAVGDRYEGAPAQFELGSLESAVGNYDEALKWLDLAVQANPRGVAVRYAHGIALRQAGRIEEATRELQAVQATREALKEVDRLVDQIEDDPALVDERVRIGEIYMLHESQKTGEFWLKAALARNPNHPRAHELLAEYYFAQSKTNAAYLELAKHHRELAKFHAGDGERETSSP